MTQTQERPVVKLTPLGWIQEIEKCQVPHEDQRPAFDDEAIDDIIRALEKIARTGDLTRMKNKVNVYKGSTPAFAELFKDPQTDTPLTSKIDESKVLVPPLPIEVQLSPEQSDGACPWIDDYVAFSKHWSPRSFGNFHEACGWWLLSTIAKRRVALDLGDQRYTPLLIAVVAKSSIASKSEAAKVVLGVMDKAGLGWTRGADSMSPQAMIGDMAIGKPPDNYGSLSLDEQKEVERSLAYQGQRGWFYEEFGQQMDAMMQKSGGPMTEFKGLIRRLDDCYPTYERLTVAHKKQVVEAPYLSLLACMTPPDLKPYAASDSALWRDGFFARFAFITPEEKNRSRDRFPEGNLKDAIPTSLIQPLQSWHKRLGDRKVLIDTDYDERKKETKYIISYGEFPIEKCILTKEAEDAFYAYNNALLDIKDKEPNFDQFESNYTRLHMIALRIAMLCASIGNNGRIEFRHWAKGQEFAEKARTGLHALQQQLDENTYVQDRNRLEDEIIQYVEKSKTLLTSRMMRKNKFKDKAAETFDPLIESLEKSGDLVLKRVGRAKFYTVPGEENRPSPVDHAREGVSE